MGRAEGPGLRESAAEDYVSFWEGQARKLEWSRPWDRALDWDPPRARWFEGGELNASANALDAHRGISGRAAILWEGEDGTERRITYGGLLRTVERLAGALESLGVRRGDRVAIYLPMVPELPAAMLACARIGAAHAVVFSGFSAASLRSRVADSGARVLVTADGGYRRGRVVPLKEIADEAVSGLGVRCVVVRRTGAGVRMGPGDAWWDDLLEGAPAAPAAPVPSSHPLFILYTSGTTGRPKGVVHGTGGYLTHVASTFRWAFGPGDRDVYYCTADIGWVTGHSYVAYAPLVCGATQVVYEGAPDHPGPSRTWEILEKSGVSVFYTTPPALRMLARSAPPPSSYGLSGLRLLGSVGEPINPSVWEWYRDEVGGSRCPVVDTWWQTETGGMMISDLPGIEDPDPVPGWAGRAVPGVDVGVVGADGRPAPPGERGHLVVRRPWPGMLLGLWGDEGRYREAYWSRFPGAYHAGDHAVMDGEGRVRLLGRSDDVLKVAGHRIGTAELEGCLVSHPGVAEAAVCGIPDETRGQAIAAFVVPRGAPPPPGELEGLVRREVGPIAVPSAVFHVQSLPKTRSGKILRRLLQAMATGGDLGDTSTLEDPGAVGDVRGALAGSGGAP